jgi:hypothetical protein
MILNGMQWGQAYDVPMTFVGAMQSGNNPNMTVEEEYQTKRKRGEFQPNDFNRLMPGIKDPQQHQDEITSHIDQHGQINPIQFSAYKGHQTTLDEGYHRYAAHRDLGLEGIRAKYYGDVHE